MLQLSKQSMTQTFLQLGFSPLDYLYLDQIQKILNQLNQQPFDTQTLQELQNQCTTNSRGQIKVEDMIGAFIKAENILVQRDYEIKKLVTKLQKEVSDKYKSQGEREGQKLEEELYEAKEEMASNNINLQIIRKPFMSKKSFMSHRTPRHQAQYQSQFSPQNRSPSHRGQGSLLGQSILTISNTHTFTWIFELSILLLVILLPCMFYTPCYMSCLLLLLIVLNMVSGYFCRFILRVWMGLVAMSLPVDVVWYLIGIRPYWHPTHDFTADVLSYVRFTVILYGVVVLGKLILLVLLVSQYNTDQSQKKIVSAFGFFEIQLSHDDHKRNIFSFLNKKSPHQYLQDRIN